MVERAIRFARRTAEAVTIVGVLASQPGCKPLKDTCVLKPETSQNPKGAMICFDSKTGEIKTMDLASGMSVDIDEPRQLQTIEPHSKRRVLTDQEMDFRLKPKEPTSIDPMRISPTNTVIPITPFLR